MPQYPTGEYSTHLHKGPFHKRIKLWSYIASRSKANKMPVPAFKFQQKGKKNQPQGNECICYFTGWEKCRSKCPVRKPEPPVAVGAQLEPKDPNGIWDNELWESESISYKCQNDTLVIDNKKGNVEVKYTCLPDGTYNTPKADHLWPRCTEPPIDPCECKE